MKKKTQKVISALLLIVMCTIPVLSNVAINANAEDDITVSEQKQQEDELNKKESTKSLVSDKESDANEEVVENQEDLEETTTLEDDFVVEEDLFNEKLTKTSVLDADGLETKLKVLDNDKVRLSCKVQHTSGEDNKVSLYFFDNNKTLTNDIMQWFEILTNPISDLKVETNEPENISIKNYNEETSNYKYKIEDNVLSFTIPSDTEGVFSISLSNIKNRNITIIPVMGSEGDEMPYEPDYINNNLMSDAVAADKTFLVRYTLVDGEKISKKVSIDDIFKDDMTDNKLDELVTLLVETPVYINDENTYKVLADAPIKNGWATGKIYDAIFTRGNNYGEVISEGVKWDEQTQTAIIDKDVLNSAKENDFCDMQMQVLLPVDTNKEASIEYSVNNDDELVDIVQKNDTLSFSPLWGTYIDLCTPDTATNITKHNIGIYLNDCKYPLNDNQYEFEEETGKIKIFNQAGVTYKIHIDIVNQETMLLDAGWDVKDDGWTVPNSGVSNFAYLNPKLPDWYFSEGATWRYVPEWDSSGSYFPTYRNQGITILNGAVYSESYNDRGEPSWDGWMLNSGPTLGTEGILGYIGVPWTLFDIGACKSGRIAEDYPGYSYLLTPDEYYGHTNTVDYPYANYIDFAWYYYKDGPAAASRDPNGYWKGWGNGDFSDNVYLNQPLCGYCVHTNKDIRNAAAWVPIEVKCLNKTAVTENSMSPGDDVGNCTDYLFSVRTVDPWCGTSTGNTKQELQAIFMLRKMDEPKNGFAKVQKISSNPDCTTDNENYSLEGAKYGVFLSKKDASPKGQNKQIDESLAKAILITDEKGETKKAVLDPGTYYVKEISASKGYYVDSKIHEVVIKANETAVVTSIEQPMMDPVGVLLSKHDADTGKNVPQGDGSLEGAEYTMKYYKEILGDPDQDPAKAGKTPVRTWVFRTDKYGYTYYKEKGMVDDKEYQYKVSGPELYYQSNGDPAVPAGTITIQETKAPDAYHLNPEVYVRQFKLENMGESNHGVNTSNMPKQPERSFQVNIEKKLEGTNIPIPDVEFTHVKPDGTKETARTDKNGKVAFKGLVAGEHTIYESGKPFDVLLNNAKVRFKVANGKMTLIGNTSDKDNHIDFNVVDDDGVMTVWDRPNTFMLDVHKINEKGMVLGGAEFTLYNDKGCTDKVVTEKTDMHGKLTFKDLKLNHVYYLKETKAPQGYRIPINKDGSDIISTIEIRDNFNNHDGFGFYFNGEFVNGDKPFGYGNVSIANDIIRTDITVENLTTIKLPETGTKTGLMIMVIGFACMGTAFVLSKKKIK